MTYEQQYDAAENPAGKLSKQVTVALLKAATDVINEDPATANHANRILWAHRMTSYDNAKTEARARIWAILLNNSIPGDVGTATDAAVQNAVNSFIDLWASE